jgi:hypothetical protein
MPSEKMLVAIGLFEGEGCISHSKRTRKDGVVRRYPQMSLSMTCEDVVRKFHDAVGYGKVYSHSPKKDGWKPFWVWSLSSAREIETLLTTFIPFLGEKKQQEARKILDICSEIGPVMRDRRHCKNGHEYTEANTAYVANGQYRQRICRLCKKARR